MFLKKLKKSIYIVILQLQLQELLERYNSKMNRQYF